MRILLFFFFFFYVIVGAMGQSNPPKREFRAAWVATVLNIDFPPKGIWKPDKQRQEWIRILDELKALNFNAVIFQVRPSADVFYPSDYEPWSAYLTGTQGRAPTPYYDPLAFLIKECHLRSMEFHAWVNPYRATTNLDTNKLAENHPLKIHPERFFKYGTRYYFNPARQDVRDYISEVVVEIVEKYDVDGIHFDDYFYPYKIKDERLPDEKDFAASKGSFQNIEDWRRNNVSLLIEQLSLRIKSIKPYVQFGISPFGVWRNKDKDPIRGSDTRAGVTCYDDLYADVLLWMENSWIDYVAPQIYWHIGHPAADFETIAKWWNENSYGKNVYIGHAVYKIDTDQYEEWHDPEELGRQIDLLRGLNHIKGSIYYNTSSLRKNPLNINTTFQQDYRYPSLPFASASHSHNPSKAAKLRKVKKKKKGLRIKWKQKGKTPFYYVVYKFRGKQISNYENAQNIWHISPFYPKKKITLYDTTYQTGQAYTYIIASVNRMHFETLSNAKTAK